MSLLPDHEMAAKASEVIALCLASKGPSDCLPHVAASTMRCFGAPSPSDINEMLVPIGELHEGLYCLEVSCRL